ncbi:MAG: hypothetical protein LQ343_003208 [Gyalolechia ehrenbergii]|nr:MAG: hypothetical protein LQ343_003208 [Gyalolechia ehrenbergii]
MAPSTIPIVHNKSPSNGKEDDYMSMAIVEPSSTLSHTETSAQRHARKKREAEARAYQPSKAELARQAEFNRDEALNASLPTTSKGYQMMAKLGFKTGSALGKEGNEHARKEPLGVVVKEGRAGVGMDSETKRKFREEASEEGGDEGVHKKRETEGEFRERQGREREEKRLEGLCWGAMKVLEGFESEDAESSKVQDEEGGAAERKKPRPTKQINLLWRWLVRDRQERERERRMRYDLHQSLSRNAAYDDPDEDKQDKQALGDEEEEVEEEDPELEEFNVLEPAERLRKMVEYLREKWKYCFWCKFQYPDEAMEGCPGLTEDEHG